MSFSFKQFCIDDSRCAMKVGTDGVLVGAWSAPLPGCEVNSILDIGAGSGLVALMAAQRFPAARVTAIEIDPDACADARDNVARSPWNDRINVICDDIMSAAASLGKFDLIISNPPFFNESLHAPDASRAIARHGDTFGVPQLISIARDMLTPCGSLCFIAPFQRDSETDLLVELSRFHTTAITRVKSKTSSSTPIRTLRRLSLSPSPCLRSDIAIRDCNGAYTSRYISLTKDFYLAL